MPCIYKLTKTAVTDECGKPHITFGIAVYENGAKDPTRIIDSIFTDLSMAEEFVLVCNRLELSPDHLDDVIADTLSVI